MDFRALLMGLAFATMWSSAFTSARMIVMDAPPLLALTVRFVLSGVLAVAIASAMGQTFQLTRAQWRATLIFGICQNALYLGMNFLAMQRIEAGLAAIIASALPLLVAAAGWAFLRDRPPALALFGLLAGFAGVLMIMGVRLAGGLDLFGLTYAVVGVLALTVATLMLREASSGGNVMMVVGLQMLVGAAALALPALALETPLVNWTWRLFWAFLYTTLVPGLAATWVWFRLVQRIGAVKAATFHFLNPFLGVAIAAVLLGEKVGLLDVFGVAVIMAGILAVQLSRAAPKPRPAQTPLSSSS